MKIAIATNSFWNYMKFRKNLVRNLIREGHKIFVLTENINIKFNKLKDIKFIKIPIKRRPFNFFHDLFLIYNFFKIFKFYKVDFFLGFSHKINIYGGLVCRILKIKNILNVTGLGTAFIEKKYLKYIIFFFYKLINSNNTFYLFHNFDDKFIFLKNNIVNKKNSFVIPGSGIDTTKKIYYKKKSIRNNSLVFTFVGRLIKQKGISEFLDAANLCLNENINKKKIIFKVIGKIDPDNISSIKKETIDSFKNNKNFIFKGYLNEKNVFKEILNSDCIVLPSYREGLPRVILEAFLCSRPVIATNVPGCNRIVKNKYNGFLCKPRSPRSLFNCFKKFIQLKDKKKYILGINGRKLVIKSYDENLVIDKYKELLKK